MNRRLAVPLAVLVSSCVWTFQGVRIAPLERPTSPGDSVAVASPVKAHLADGSTVVFPTGVRFVSDTIWGQGMRYDLTLRDSVRVQALALDSVIGMEAFRTHVDAGTSTIVSLVATGGVILGAAATIVAISCINDPKCFGSCPTYYSDSAGAALLEAEGFSYSIAPLFEARDVDRLRLAAVRDGAVRLEVRNEAFETHYINHLALLEVPHATDELVLPDQQNRPLAVRDAASVTRARDRQGRDVKALLGAADGAVYRTDPRILAEAHVGDLQDWVELAVPVRPGADSAVLVLRLRNSLLNTILFYDIMLGDPGARSLDWVARDLEQVGPAVELAQWYQRIMGMQIAVWDGAGYRDVAHLKDTGPVAWKDVAIVVPVLEDDSVRIRLSFPADNWRIDRVTVAAGFRHPVPVVHLLTDVRDGAGRSDTAARASLAAADEHYLETSAGERFIAEFRVDTGVAAPRTFLLASQGYYSEWVRRGWLAAPRSARTFAPSDSALAEAIGRWRVTQDTLEARFMATRVPVR